MGSARRRARARRAIGRPLSTWAGRGGESGGRLARGRRGSVTETTETAFELAQERKRGWLIGELAYWRWRAGVEEEVPPALPSPTLPIAGEWRRAADIWAELGCPYEHALALADADDEATLLRALEELQRLGARPAAAIVARRLRERGAHGLPRGPRPGTRKTGKLDDARARDPGARRPRVTEQGHRGALFLSRGPSRTTSRRYCASSMSARGEASAAAVRLGVAGQDR